MIVENILQLKLHITKFLLEITQSQPQNKRQTVTNSNIYLTLLVGSSISRIIQKKKTKKIDSCIAITNSHVTSLVTILVSNLSENAV